MYSFSQLKSGLSHPSLILREVNRYYHRRFYLTKFNPSGSRIFDEDWDNLIILDACRYDAFEEKNTLSGRLESRQSMASETVGFLEANFGNRELTDTVYVTANPQFYRHRNELNTTLHEVVHVWKDEGWDEEYGTVLPETTVKYAREAASRFPTKKLVVHFIQPHYPFLDLSVEFDKGHLELEGEQNPNLWYRKMYGELDVSGDGLWELYLESLERTMTQLELLLEELVGKSVVTADHGNMFGERSFPIPIREWGHPHSTFTEELVKVPWFEMEDRRRRETVPEPPQYTPDEGSSVEERLRDLGYVE